MFKIKDYIITPLDLYKTSLYAAKKASRKDIAGIFVLAGLFLFFKSYLGWQTDSSLFMIFWIALFYWNLDSRISIAGALACLVSCPILLILENNYGFVMGEIWAEQAAVYAYYFLVIGVTKQIWEFRKEDAEEKKEKPAEETAKNISSELEKTAPPATPEIDLKKAKTIEELIKEAQRGQKPARRQIQRRKEIAGQKIVMDIIPPKNLKQ